jgi:hypothetical protein
MGRTFWAKYDNRHKINLVASYKLSDKTEINGSWTYYSGNRMTVKLEYYEHPPFSPGNNPDAQIYYWTPEQDGPIAYYQDKNNYIL